MHVADVQDLFFMQRNFFAELNLLDLFYRDNIKLNYVDFNINKIKIWDTKFINKCI